MSINENEAAADVTAFVSYRNRASRADDNEREMRASQSCLVCLMTPTGLTNLTCAAQHYGMANVRFPHVSGGNGSSTTVESGGRIENSSEMMAEHRGGEGTGGEKPNHGSDAFGSTRTRFHRLLHVF